MSNTPLSDDDLYRHLARRAEGGTPAPDLWTESALQAARQTEAHLAPPGRAISFRVATTLAAAVILLTTVIAIRAGLPDRGQGTAGVSGSSPSPSRPAETLRATLRESPVVPRSSPVVPSPIATQSAHATTQPSPIQQAPSPTITPAIATMGTGEAGDFRLDLSATRASWRAEEAIDVHAELTYLGTAGKVVVGSSGSGLLSFSVTRLQDGMTLGGDTSTDCGDYVLKSGRPRSVAFTKSGGYGVKEPEPEFYGAWLGDPLLRLPPGTWSVRASAYLDTDGCGGDDVLTPIRATITLRIE